MATIGAAEARAAVEAARRAQSQREPGAGIVASFIRARYATRCTSCGGKLAVGELVHWARDSRRTWITHSGHCPGSPAAEAARIEAETDGWRGEGEG